MFNTLFTIARKLLCISMKFAVNIHDPQMIHFNLLVTPVVFFKTFIKPGFEFRDKKYQTLILKLKFTQHFGESLSFPLELLPGHIVNFTHKPKDFHDDVDFIDPITFPLALSSGQTLDT